MKAFAVFFSPPRARLLCAIGVLAAGPNVALAQQPAKQPLAVNQLHDVVNAAVARHNGNVRMLQDSCRRESENEVCYYKLSNEVAVKARSFGPDKVLRHIHVEVPVDKENTEKLYRTTWVLAIALDPDLTETEFRALKTDLAEAQRDIMGSALHQLPGLDFKIQLGLDTPQSWWERLFSKTRTSALDLYIE